MSKKTINEVSAISNMLVRKSNNIKDLELKKLFFMCLASVPDYHEKLENDTIIINKKEMFEYLGLDWETNHDVYKTYRKLFEKLIKATWYERSEETGDMFGYMFYDVDARGSTYKILVNKKFLPALSELKRDFTKFLTNDVMQFKSGYTTTLYQYLMSHTNKKELDFTTKQLKELFGLSKEDYCNKKGKFDRTNFEKYTIKNALKELDEKCKSIIIFKQLDKNGKSVLYRKTYKKDKNGNNTRFVDKYVIRYMIIDPHDIVNSEKDNDVLEGQISIFDDEVRPRSGSKPLSVVDRRLIENVNKNIYNWLEN